MAASSPATKRLVALLLALVAVASSALPGTAARSKTKRIGPGVTYTVIQDKRGPWRIKVITIELSARSTIDVALSNDVLPGYETTSSMARRHHAIAAINGDYARQSGRPVFTFAEDGLLAQTPLLWGRNFAVARDESQSFIGHPETQAYIYEKDVDFYHWLSAVNAGEAESDQVALFTPDGGKLEPPPARSCAARLQPEGRPRIEGVQPYVTTNQVVEKVVCRRKRLPLRGGSVLAAPNGSAYGMTVAAMAPGEKLQYGWTLGWPNVVDTIGGNPTLIEAGRTIGANVDGTGEFFWRHPRTGVGTTADGEILLVTVDGRDPKRSVGMTLREFADLFASLGATYALNLDGGGSTTTVVDGRVVNTPSDGYERPVSSALLVLARKDGAETLEPAPTPPPPSLLPQEIWRQVVADPASTGGMAAAFSGERDAPRFIRRAARIFEEGQ